MEIGENSQFRVAYEEMKGLDGEDGRKIRLLKSKNNFKILSRFIMLISILIIWSHIEIRRYTLVPMTSYQ